MSGVLIVKIAEAVGGEVRWPRSSGDQTISVGAISHDSRRVRPNSLFACVPGDLSDGHTYAAGAVAAGAVALLVEHRVESDVPQIVVSDVRHILGVASALIFGNPADSLITIGVTGTSGKTTVVHLLESVLTNLGVKSGSVGTLSGERTTPEAPELQERLSLMVKEGTSAVGLEVSSHALCLGRVSGMRFDRAIFTNLGHDHLDFHGTMDAYRDAKASLFDSTYTAVSVVNRDDETGRWIAANTDTEVVTYGLDDAKDLSIGGLQSEFTWRGHRIVLKLPGQYNVLNALAVANAVESLGHPPSVIGPALAAVSGPPGRFEVVPTNAAFHIVVDYAHKPEALRASLGTARQIAGTNRVFVVFGCGGDRDKGKRPVMGEIAFELADNVIVTSDNPRSEDPDQIIAEILGVTPPSDSVTVEPDRRKAIEAAIGRAEPGDLVLIAGKGHETYQEIQGARVHFDDRHVASELVGGSE